MRYVVVFLALSATCFAAQPSDDAVKKELKLFQGKWVATFAQGADGKPISDEILKETTLEVTGDTFVLKQPGTDTVEMKFKIDPTQKIKTIDVVDKNSPDHVLVKGIYEIKGDTRRSCFAEPGKERPTAFTKEKGYLVLEWKQAK